MDKPVDNRQISLIVHFTFPTVNNELIAIINRLVRQLNKYRTIDLNATEKLDRVKTPSLRRGFPFDALIANQH
jgi:hypothetical protein